MKVLVATDGETHSQHGIDALAAVADRARTSIEVISVNSFDVSLKVASGGGPGGHYDPEAGRKACQEAVDAAVSHLGNARFENVTGRVIEGDASTEVIQVAAEEGFDLIVVGAGSERWLDAVMLGSTSTSILHHAPCSVLVAHMPRGAASDTAEVLIATDGSPESIVGARRFGALADPARCSVRVVAVDEHGRHPEAADDAIGSVTGVLGEGGFESTSEVLQGHPARTLLGEAANHDLSVVGATGAGRFAKALVVSTSDKVARHAPATLVAR